MEVCCVAAGGRASFSFRFEDFVEFGIACSGTISLLCCRDVFVGGGFSEAAIDFSFLVAGVIVAASVSESEDDDDDEDDVSEMSVNGVSVSSSDRLVDEIE